MKSTIIAAMAALTMLALAMGAYAHGGGTDANGCHTNHKTGEYHCH
ncbi:YHYH domain-containing protein [Mesorhizobium sp. L2C066B000]|nr:YHYH domain-containing protein [Mesorhizobium sp. L2C066B000]